MSQPNDQMDLSSPGHTRSHPPAQPRTLPTVDMADDDSDDPYAEMADGGANPFGFSAAPQGAGSLASLFGGGAPPGGPGAEGDMSYRPKPQPKAGAQQPRAAGAAPKASILLSLRAREVYLFVAAENRQVPQGPCGVVFLGDMAMGAYTLLLYKSQENHLARVPFTDRFKLETTVRHRSIPTASALPAPVCAALLAQARELTWMLAAAPGQRAVRHAVRHHSGERGCLDAALPDRGRSVSAARPPARLPSFALSSPLAARAPVRCCACRAR